MLSAQKQIQTWRGIIENVRDTAVDSHDSDELRRECLHRGCLDRTSYGTSAPSNSHLYNPTELSQISNWALIQLLAAPEAPADPIRLWFATQMLPLCGVSPQEIARHFNKAGTWWLLYCVWMDSSFYDHQHRQFWRQLEDALAIPPDAESRRPVDLISSNYFSAIRWDDIDYRQLSPTSDRNAGLRIRKASAKRIGEHPTDLAMLHRQLPAIIPFHA